MATHELTNESELENSLAVEPQQEEEENKVQRHLPQRSPHLYRRSNQENATTPTTDSGESLYTWRKPFRTPSDSGTEADDEANGALKRVPAPLVSKRIEYRFKRGTTERKEHGDSTVLRRSKKRRVETPDTEELEFHISIGARLRIEVLRRICETGLVLGVAFAVMLRRGVRSVVKSWFLELSVFSLLILGLYAIFPLRKCPYGSYRTKLKRIIAFPFSRDIDPAPLIYPILIPVLTALSLGPSYDGLVLLNIILSLSSLPAATIPLHGSGSYSAVHWLITAIPLFVSERVPFCQSPGRAVSELGLEPELLILIFPLQKSTISIIEYLVTSSLLPTEVQLLGTALVNVLLVSNSPQAQILKALVWLGAFCIFVTCKHALLWEATLARIPSWKFRRASIRTTDDENILGALDRQVCHTLNHPFSEDQASESEALMDIVRTSGRQASVLYNNFTKILATELDFDKRAFKRHESTQQSVSAVENETKIEASLDSLDDRTQLSRAGSQHSQHVTTSKAGGMTPLRRTTTKGGRRKRQIPQSMRAFLSLTMEQATIRKWAYAVYVYAMVLTIILVPVRWYVARYALGGREPFGWAIGYLFGNIPSIRFTLLLWSLEGWACIPPRIYDSSASCHLGWVEHLRRDTVGEANSRLFLCAYCILILAVGLSLVYRLSRVVEVDTRRKIFHGMMVAMFFPTVFIDPTFVALSCILVLAIFLLLELFRVSQVPPLARWLSYFLAPYVDGRDHRGPVIVSHIFLMLGCALPLLLSLAGTPHLGSVPWEGWEVDGRDVSMVSGIVCVGMGDAAASLVGRRYGRRRWFWGGDKSIEGSASFAAAVFIGLVTARVWLVVGGWEANVYWALTITKSTIAAVASSFMEAVLTGGNDNVVVPLVLWLLVRGLRL
ncbi:dolichol kinase [Microsporum audouinii]